MFADVFIRRNRRVNSIPPEIVLKAALDGYTESINIARRENESAKQLDKYGTIEITLDDNVVSASAVFCVDGLKT